jgi:cytidylate kinase
MKIAIDGPAASGKTSLGKALARRFGCLFVETGKMYRAVALAFTRGLSLDEIDIEVGSAGRVYLNGEDVTDVLHTPQFDQGSSVAGTLPEVREHLVALQQAIAKDRDVVMEGRDIGTIVLPDADVKIFLRASPEVRARRRVTQRGGTEEELERTQEDIALRDERDSTRSIAPLNAAWDATIIDTDRKTLAEVISEATHLVKERLEERWCCG